LASLSAGEIVSILRSLEEFDAEQVAINLEGEGEKKLLISCEEEGSDATETEELRSLLSKLRAQNTAKHDFFDDLSAEETNGALTNGIVRVSSVVNNVNEIRVGGFKGGAKIGIPAIDRLYTVSPDQVTVVTGIPGAGKSELVDAFAINLARLSGWKFAVFSAENPIDIHVGKLAEKYSGVPIFEGSDKISEEGLTEVTEWLDEHFFFLDPNYSNSLDSILRRAEELVETDQINGLIIDPFNYLDVDLETNSISNMLTRLHQFAGDHHLHIWIVSHPPKLYRGKDGRMPIPTGMDISGSASWFAKCDFGITVSRSDEGETEVLVWKCRFKWLGSTGFASLSFDEKNGRYSDGTNLWNIAEEIGSIDLGGKDEEEFAF